MHIVHRIARPSVEGLNRLLKFVGLRVTRDTPLLDLREITEDPIEGAYRANGQAFVIDVPLPYCRSLHTMAFACTKDACNPFVETLLAYGLGACINYAGSPLRGYYETWQPTNAADVVGLDLPQGSRTLVDSPPLAFRLPWDSKFSFGAPAGAPPAGLTYWKAVIAAENREFGASLDMDDGWTYWGPVSNARADLEFCRLAEVYDSIRLNGYQRQDRPEGDIGGYILARNGAVRVMIRPGHHRIAALAALGYEHAPIRLAGLIVRREESRSWPNVRSGLFTPQQALAVFDRLFEGRQPAACVWTPSDISNSRDLSTRPANKQGTADRVVVTGTVGDVMNGPEPGAL